MLGNFRKSYEKFTKFRTITYIAIIITMLSVGTYFLIGGKLYARISSVTFPPEVSSNIFSNKTYFGFSLELEIWNPSVLNRIEVTPNSRFTITPCIDVIFTSLSGYNSHIVVNDIYDQTLDEYVYLQDQLYSPVIMRHVMKPGITVETAPYDMVFKEANLTRLPLGEYRMWVKISLMFGKEALSNVVTLHVFENESFVVFDTISANWGNVSLFRSCLFYYLFAGIMIILPIVNKYEKRRRN